MNKNKGSLKNIVVIKNLPSNIVEEAIVILKTNKKAKKIQKIENRKNLKETMDKPKRSEYILKEAEMLVSNYISKIEEKKKLKFNSNKKMEIKYRRIKSYAYLASLILLLESIYIIIK